MGYDGALVLEYLARTHQTSLLTDREKHLIGQAVTMTQGCRLSIDPQMKTAVVRHLTEPRYYAEGPLPHHPGRFRLSGKSLLPIAAKKIGSRDVQGFRFAFHLPREDQQWSYDYLFDAKSRRLTGYRIPGLDLLDPNKVYDSKTLRLEGGIGYLSNSYFPFGGCSASNSSNRFVTFLYPSSPSSPSQRSRTFPVLSTR